MADFGVSQHREKELRKAMRQAGLFEKDMEESFIRSSGPGGQNVNKVATCVQLCHRPTQMTVKCQRARTQALNRYYARCMLIKKIETEKEKRQQALQDLRERKKRKNRKRSKAVKEKMLEKKRHRSEKKQRRQKVDVRCVDWDG